MTARIIPRRLLAFLPPGLDSRGAGAHQALAELNSSNLIWSDSKGFLASSTRIQVRHGAHPQPLRLTRGKTVERLTMP